MKITFYYIEKFLIVAMFASLIFVNYFQNSKIYELEKLTQKLKTMARSNTSSIVRLQGQTIVEEPQPLIIGD